MAMRLEDVESARRWLNEHCHCGHVRYTLIRGIEYVEALERAGLVPNNTDGDDLYQFLTDPLTSAVRSHAFVEPTL